jgi:CRISPR-associated endonuclease/helicase Cas3
VSGRPPLLAKSQGKARAGSPPAPLVTLLDHSRQVRDAAGAVWECVEADLARTLGIEAPVLRRSLRGMLLVAGLFHDLGKANSSFQAMVGAPGNPPRQPVRHEIWSAILLSQRRFLRDWLMRALDEGDLWALTWAVGGHHLQMRSKRADEKDDPMFRLGDAARSVTLHISHDDVARVLEEVRASLGAEGGPSLPTAPPMADASLSTIDDLGDRAIEPLVDQLRRDSRAAWRTRSRDGAYGLRLALLKALVISADVAASALVAGREDIAPWVDQALRQRLSATDLDCVISAKLGGKHPRGFQETIAASESPATIAIAGCGNGKTLAAYMWAKRWANGKKLFFAYPTTGTASAGFQDYLLHHDHLPLALIHGRAWVDLAAMKGSPEDEAQDEALRLESLRAWNKVVIACTVDTVLGLLQNQRRPLFSFPAIAAGAFVFDEVHSYDPRLFGELLRFLRIFPGVPVLIMSAAISPARLERLRAVLGDRLGAVVRGDPLMERRLRYRIERRPSADECIADVERVLAQKRKVLWVCNTVDDTRRVLAKISTGGALTLVYHSRFRYRDRVTRQQELVEAFEKPGACLAITTQVCEMSLDISADLMVTARCPLPALIQRLGRLNRRAEENDPWPCLIYPFEGQPYAEPESVAQMEAMDRMVGKLSGKASSQQALACYLEKMDADAAPKESSTWLEGGWASASMPAREGDTSITLLREEDIGEIERELGKEPQRGWPAHKLVPWTIPMRLRSDFVALRRAGSLPVARSGEVLYDKEQGARWAR